MRLLFLHGYQQSPSILQEETGFLKSYLEQASGEEVELIYPTAPWPSLPRSDGEATFSWWPEDGRETGFAEATLDYLSKVLNEQGPFTGAIGFSMGATVACIIAALLEQGDADRPEEFATQHAAFEFVMSFSGYREEHAQAQPYYAHGISTPVLQFINSTDPILAEERCMALVRTLNDAEGRVVTYSGEGHRVPGTKKVKMALGRFLEDVHPGEDD